ncbi:hypothetical protein GCM10007392_37260 [Saccharospirillum salsuginis]|uniref:Uncharacterized protein n=2 Tax=Saccharospirillum salsuginis TaxID=418750 RepID=A0A918KKE5_9GAMM|nr:hypothetical protein GCM10007392_37260 [Saccharospirillum salsuginis]
MGTARAYTYTATGENVLISGRQALLSAIEARDNVALEEALDDLNEPVDFLASWIRPGLWDELLEAARDYDTPGSIKVLNQTFALDIDRRLSEARMYILQHQKAKTLVVRCQQLFTFLEPALTTTQASQGRDALNEALVALGSPGVFGVGEESPDSERLGRAIADFRHAVQSWL